MKGKVLFFNNTYGFIRGEDEKDYYVNYRNLNERDSQDGYKALYTGQSVSFDTFGKNEAMNVKIEDNISEGVLVCNITAYQMNEGEYLHSYNVYLEIFKKLNQGIRFVVYKDGFLVGLDTIITREEISLVLSKLSKNDFKNRKGEIINIHNHLSVKIV